jgi:hypothetical protein
LFFLGFKAGYLKECPAGEGFEHLEIIAGLYIFDESHRLELEIIQDL